MNQIHKGLIDAGCESRGFEGVMSDIENNRNGLSPTSEPGKTLKDVFGNRGQVGERMYDIVYRHPEYTLADVYEQFMWIDSNVAFEAVYEPFGVSDDEAAEDDRSLKFIDGSCYTALPVPGGRESRTTEVCFRR